MVKGLFYFNLWCYLDCVLVWCNLVFDVFVEQGVVIQQEVDVVKQCLFGVIWQGSMVDSFYLVFFDLVKCQLCQDYCDEDLIEEGLCIFISFDLILQEKVEIFVNEMFKCFSGCKGVDQVEVVMVVINLEIGEIQVLIGSCDLCFVGFNWVLDVVWLIGLLIKLVVYLIVFEWLSKYILIIWVQDEFFVVKGQDGQVW